MTVSRVINGESNVRPATREAVDLAIGELRYAPNSAARRLAGAARRRIALLYGNPVYGNPSAGYLGEFLIGGLDQASRRDVQLLVERCEPGEQKLEVVRQLVAGGIDGVILCPPLCDSPDLVALLAAERVPTVLVGSGRPADELMAVGIDEAAAAHDMTRHIVAMGHRRIGFVVGNPAQVASGERLAGYRAALAEAGIDYDPDLVAPGLFTYRSGLDAADRLLDLSDPPTAIFASNDDMAAAAVAVAHRRGLDVPGQLTVCGFDDTTLATAIWPELTTIRQPIADLSRTAVEMLVVNGRRPLVDAGEHHRLLDHELVRRQSDAVPQRRPATQHA